MSDLARWGSPRNPERPPTCRSLRPRTAARSLTQPEPLDAKSTDLDNSPVTRRRP